jgi:predicted amidohydrolase YtcJ
VTEHTTGTADLAIVNAAVHTVDDGFPVAEAVAVAGDRIVAVGADDDVRALIGPATEVIDAAGASLLPGFVDAHNHVRLGSNPGAVQFFGATSLPEIRERIDAFARAHPDAAWIEGEGWNYAAVPGGSPTADMLEGAGNGKALFLFSYDVHTVWLNREAISRLGITRDTVHLPWGTVEQDPATGEPTGYVHDFAVLGISEEGQRALEPFIPGYAPDAQYERLVASLDMATELGITTIVEPQNGLDDIALFVRARRDGTLRSRLIAAMLCLPGTTAERLDALEDAKRTYADDRFRVGPIKLYIDDVIEPHTAAMLAPYANAATSGDTFWPPEEFERFFLELDRRGLQAFTHATGDRGIRTVLDAVQRCRAELGPRDPRHQIVHVECVHPDDIARFGAVGVVACMQPRHCAPDIVAEWRENVGAERERYAWPFRSIAATGGVLAFSSDWNVAEMDPMTWLYTATTRADLSGNGAWNTDETIDLRTAVRAATWGSAYANHLNDRRGTIAPGKDADLVVLTRDLFEPDDPLAILDTRVATTIVAGRVVHRAP